MNQVFSLPLKKVTSAEVAEKSWHAKKDRLPLVVGAAVASAYNSVEK